ncbi:MAG: hypothetical protein M3063_03395, partial [Actinomycetota bacterium]|nr:hypothetical protein [Actinomycetota bacterium]
MSIRNTSESGERCSTIAPGGRAPRRLWVTGRRAVGYVRHASRASATGHQEMLLHAYADEHGFLSLAVFTDVGPPRLARPSGRHPTSLDLALLGLGTGMYGIMVCTSPRLLGRDPAALLALAERAEREGWELRPIAACAAPSTFSADRRPRLSGSEQEVQGESPAPAGDGLQALDAVFLHLTHGVVTAPLPDRPSKG